MAKIVSKHAKGGFSFEDITGTGARACQICEFVWASGALINQRGVFLPADSLPWFQTEDAAIPARVFGLPALQCRAEITSEAIEALTRYVQRTVEASPPPAEEGNFALVSAAGETFPGAPEFFLTEPARAHFEEWFSKKGWDSQTLLRGVIIPESILRAHSRFLKIFVSDLFHQVERTGWAMDGLPVNSANQHDGVTKWPRSKCLQALSDLGALRMSREMAFRDLQDFEEIVKDQYREKLRQQFPQLSPEDLEDQVTDGMRYRPFFRKESTFVEAGNRAKSLHFPTIFSALKGEVPWTALRPRARSNRIETRR